MKYEKHCYEIVENETNTAGLIHNAYLRYLVGESGFKALLDSGLIIPAGIESGRQVYRLKPRRTTK